MRVRVWADIRVGGMRKRRSSEENTTVNGECILETLCGKRFLLSLTFRLFALSMSCYDTPISRVPFLDSCDQLPSRWESLRPSSCQIRCESDSSVRKVVVPLLWPLLWEERTIGSSVDIASPSRNHSVLFMNTRQLGAINGESNKSRLTATGH